MRGRRIQVFSLRSGSIRIRPHSPAAPTLLVLSLLLPGCSESRQEEILNGAIGGAAAVVSEDLRVDGYHENLVPILSVAVSDGGTIALIQLQDGAVRFFSETGESLGVFGRKGDGPGELQSPSKIGWQADTAWVIDRRLLRVSYIMPSLGLTRIESRLPRIARPKDAQEGTTPVTFSVLPHAPGPGGGLYAGLTPHQRPAPAPFDDYGTLAHVDEEGVVTNVVLPLLDEVPTGPIRNIPRYAIEPRANRAAVAMASLDGDDAGTVLLVSVDLAGDTIFARRFTFDGEPIPKSVIDSLREGYSRSRASARSVAGPTGGVPTLYPPLLGLVIGLDRSIWIRVRLRKGRILHFVLAPDGEPLGTVALPAGSAVVAAINDRIWAIEEDSLGVESLVRYKVAWP